MILPQVQKYLDLLKHDLTVLELLTQAARVKDSPEDVSDWQLTLLFYLACIYVKVAGCLYSQRFDDHISLRQWINTEADMWGMAKDYRKLEEASRDARYEGRLFPLQDLRSVHLGRFEAVRQHVVSILRARGIANIPHIDPRRVL